MAISLYDATVGRFLQGLQGLGGVLEKGRAHAAEIGLDLEELAGASLWPDMRPLSYQVVAAKYHSLGAVEGVMRGAFSPPPNDPHTYAEIEELAAETHEALLRIEPDAVDALADRPVIFKGRRDLPFTGAGFLLSFSVPNFYFHAATAYDLLRMKGGPLSKRDFLGPLRLAETS